MNDMNIRENMLPVLGPKGGGEEVQAIREVIESGWWGKGPKVAEFEEKFAEMTPFFEKQNDIRNNIATLSTLLVSQGVIKEQDFADCMADIQTSFGVIDSEGNMAGEVIVTEYNRSKSGGEK